MIVGEILEVVPRKKLVHTFQFTLLPQDAPKEDSRFTRLRKLVGEWATEAKPGKVAASWRLTAGGSALLETFLPGSDHEMVTMDAMDGKNLKLTHYCMMGNQPSMTAAKEIQDGVLAFECSGVGNTKSHDDPHMHSARFTFTSDDSTTADAAAGAAAHGSGVRARRPGWTDPAVSCPPLPPRI